MRDGVRTGARPSRGRRRRRPAGDPNRVRDEEVSIAAGVHDSARRAANARPSMRVREPQGNAPGAHARPATTATERVEPGAPDSRGMDDAPLGAALVVVIVAGEVQHVLGMMDAERIQNAAEVGAPGEYLPAGTPADARDDDERSRIRLCGVHDRAGLRGPVSPRRVWFRIRDETCVAIVEPVILAATPRPGEAWGGGRTGFSCAGRRRSRPVRVAHAGVRRIDGPRHDVVEVPVRGGRA